MYARMLVCVWRGASGGGITHPTQSIVGRRESGRRGEEGEEGEEGGGHNTL